MSTAQRSKTGCWSCRLRRKKCNEGGPPCSNCESRGVFCHGYGPKPPWKDRGEKEREEANRLQLQSRMRRSRPKTLYSSISQLPSASGASIDVTSPGPQSPLQTDFSLSPLSSPEEHHVFEFLDTLELAHGSWDAPFSNDLWPSASSAEALVGLSDLQPPARNLRPGPALSFPSAPTAHGTDVGEREVELVMHFMGETFPLQHTSYRTASTVQRSWLLFLLMRSPTFYFASLSMSAYHYFLTLSGDSEARRITFLDYQKYRACALRGFCELLESGRSSASSSGSLLGECMICGVQIALLEAFGKNMQDCQSHLNSAVQSLLNDGDFISANRVSSPTVRTPSVPPQLITSTDSPTVTTPHPSHPSHPSPMERKALGFFRALLVWSDILSCSTQKKAPLAAETYRKLLADEDFAQTFRDVAGCESWILVTIIDATILETWKRDQEVQGNLSIRELVSRAEKIESVLEQGIEDLSTILQSQTPVADASYQNSHLYQVQTYIFAHAVLIHLHTIVSGSWPGVPEIQQTVDRAISAWKLRPSSINLKALVWPYCVSASLAVDSQRDFFRRLIPEASSREPTLGNLLGLRAVVEGCWRGFDGRASDRDGSCDWMDVMQKLNLSILFA